MVRNVKCTGGEEAGRELLAAHPQLTAVVALNDMMAAGVLAALRKERLALLVLVAGGGPGIMI